MRVQERRPAALHDCFPLLIPAKNGGITGRYAEIGQFLGRDLGPGCKPGEELI